MANLDPGTIDKKERRIPIAAAEAFRAAQEAALRAGLSVLVVEDGRLVRLMPSGKREFVRWVGRRVRVKRNGKTAVRWRTTFPD